MAATWFRLQIEGHLDSEWSEWFDGMAVECRPDDTTTLIGPVRDQAALQGLLLRVRDLGLSLISVNRVESRHDERNSGD